VLDGAAEGTAVHDGGPASNSSALIVQPPARCLETKLYYNCIITLVSALIAILISGIEVAGLIVDNFGFSGALSLVADLAEHFNLLGAVIVAGFIGSWLASMAFSRARRITKSAFTTES
jgi:high-affinity nickel permease